MDLGDILQLNSSGLSDQWDVWSEGEERLRAVLLDFSWEITWSP